VTAGLGWNGKRALDGRRTGFKKSGRSDRPSSGWRSTVPRADCGHCRVKLGIAHSIREVHRCYDGLTSRSDLLSAHQTLRRPLDVAIDVKDRDDRAADPFLLQTRKDMARLWCVDRIGGIRRTGKNCFAPRNRAGALGRPVERRLSLCVGIVELHLQQSKQDRSDGRGAEPLR
jgi:hypothetical protein